MFAGSKIQILLHSKTLSDCFHNQFQTGKNTSLFYGPEDRRTPTHNLLASQQKVYFFIGKCIALSLSYSDPGPHFLCETIVRYLCNEPYTSVLIDVPNYEVRERIEKVRVCHLYIV